MTPSRGRGKETSGVSGWEVGDVRTYMGDTKVGRGPHMVAVVGVSGWYAMSHSSLG